MPTLSSLCLFTENLPDWISNTPPLSLLAAKKEEITNSFFAKNDGATHRKTQHCVEKSDIGVTDCHSLN